jgi:hypothetical protein
MIPNLSKPEINLDLSKKIFVKAGVLSNDACEELINASTDSLNKGEDKYPEFFTTSFSSCLLPLDHSIHSDLQETYSEINNFFNFDISFAEPYEIKRYQGGDYFGSHFDNYGALSENIDRKLTIVVFLSKENSYEGGELNIFGKDIKIEQGSVVAFPSFFPHSVKKITSGERWSVITWLWGNYWK